MLIDCNRFNPLSMRSLLISILILYFPVQGFSQKPSPEPEIEKTINRLFDGMRKGDSTILKSVFHQDAQMATTYTDQQGLPAIRQRSVAQFIQRAGIPHDNIWNEKINNLMIRQEDNLAIAWMQYAFFLGDEFSHCGVNVINLVKSEFGWKIYDLIDTRKSENCDGYGE